MRMTLLLGSIVSLILLSGSLRAEEGRWRGHIGLEGRFFFDEGAFENQLDGFQGSLVLQPEYFKAWASGWSLELQPFLRIDSEDSERTHFDLRELQLRKSGGNWDLLLGVSKVFWGVTESQHLVDIINQTDGVEAPDGEEKLGQPMARLSWIRDWGILDIFVLPGFRERTFPGDEGRLRPGIPIAVDDARYQSSAEQGHVDFAMRWSHAIGAFDLGLSHFNGTSRDPLLLPGRSPEGELRLIPFYEQIDQTGLDIQATVGSLLLKLEAIHRWADREDHAALTAGFEYTFWGALGTPVDVGVLGEYLWDERGERAPSSFDDDLFLGTRLAFNDVQSTEILAGVILDLESDAWTAFLEASRRLGESWTLELEARAFSGSPTNALLSALDRDSYLQASLQRHF